MGEFRKQADERLQQILDKSLELFNDHGFDQVVMADIAKACNFARSSVYEYFSNKDEILIQLIDGLSAAFAGLDESGKSTKKQLRNLMQTCFKLTIENEVLLRLYYANYARLSKRYEKDFSQWQHSIQEHIAAVLSRALDVQADPRLAADYIFFLINGKIQAYLMQGMDLRPTEDAAGLANFIMNGIK